MSRQIQREVKARLEEIMARRPVGTGSADQALRRAVELFQDGSIKRLSLPSAGVKLASLLRQDIPDVLIVRAPRTLSLKHAQTSVIAYETRVIEEGDQKLITIESHTIVLRESSILFVSGLLPGMTRPHLFRRVLERGGPLAPFAETQIQMSALWPTILWMRSEQRLAGRGTPITAIVTLFANGLFFSAIEKTEGLPPAGPRRAIVDDRGTEHRTLRDFYSDGSARVSVMTKTFVDGSKLSPSQRELRNRLKAFIAEFADVVIDNDWRWKIGLGEVDKAVTEVARAFRLRIPAQERRLRAFQSLEAIVTSDFWLDEEARNLDNQQNRKTPAAAET